MRSSPPASPESVKPPHHLALASLKPTIIDISLVSGFEYRP